jgi:bacillithiol biosynthesis cysteine-adding enzyme BshC
MSVSPDIAASGVVRGAIDIRRFPWIRPLVGAYTHDFASVAPLFAGDPADPEAWRQTIRRVQRAPRDREQLVALLDRQLENRRAPADARQAAATLTDPASVAILTGQQAGVFGGPLYTLLKAVTALQLAQRVREEHGTPAVAVFWVDEEDHDWEEIRSAQILDGEFTPRRVTVSDVDGAGAHMVSKLVFDAGINDAIAELEQLLPRTDFTAEVVAQLREHYRPGAGVARAFAGWLDALLGHRGLVVFESADRAAKALVGDLFVRELEHPGRTAALAQEAAAEMTRLGHEPQVEPGDDSVALFHLAEGGRLAIKRRGGAYAVGDDVRPTDALVEEARSSPEQFSPNVLLRPLVQDRLFPTVCYVSGPSELAYQAQLKRIYHEFGVEVPLLYPRATATLFDSAAQRFLDRHHLPLEALHVQDDSTLNRVLESLLPPSIERALEDLGQDVARRGEALKQELTRLDPTLGGAVDTTVERMREVVKSLHHKIVHAAKRKDDTLRRQFNRTRHLAFPDGHPQERVLNLVFALNRYGPALGDRLVDVLPVDTGKHYVLTL